MNLIRVIFIDSRHRAVYEERIPPSFEGMEKLLGTPFWIDLRFKRDSILCEERNNSGPIDFWLYERDFTGSAIIHGLEDYMIPCDPDASLEYVRSIVRFK